MFFWTVAALPGFAGVLWLAWRDRDRRAWRIIWPVLAFLVALAWGADMDYLAEDDGEAVNLFLVVPPVLLALLCRHWGSLSGRARLAAVGLPCLAVAGLAALVAINQPDRPRSKLRIGERVERPAGSGLLDCYVEQPPAWCDTKGN